MHNPNEALKQLRDAASLQDIAVLLGFKPKALAYVLYIKPVGERYKKFEIPKRSGGSRTISAPYPDLKNLQKRLTNLLQDCVAKIEANKKSNSVLSHGFRPKFSIITNAQGHRNRRYVFNVDLENFFGTINFGRVRGFFISNRDFQLKPEVATIVAQIACFENALPQGSPCSPVISNLIGHMLDIRLAALAYKVGCTYSRYVDDITFSTNKRDFPPAIARSADGLSHEWNIGDELLLTIRRYGFSVNDKKTRMQYQGSRQEVTGLIVNSKLNTRFEYRHRARAMVHLLRTTGSYYRTTTLAKEGEGLVTEKHDGTIDQLNGILSFIDSVDVFNKKKDLSAEQRKIPLPYLEDTDGREKAFRDFLFYKHFFPQSRPLIICEGKTDNVYIKAAINALSDSYPELVKKDGAGKPEFLVSVFRRTSTTDRFLGLTGGSSQLVTLIKKYLTESKKVTVLKSTQPVVLIIDNDDGAKGVYSYLGKYLDLGKPVSNTVPFIKAGEKLYVIPTPLSPLGKSSMIEDFFEESVRKTTLEGKTFNPKNEELNHKSEYGKAYFAWHVVKKNQATINFNGFKPILARLIVALNDHKAKHA